MCDYCIAFENGDIDYEPIVSPAKGLSARVGVNANTKTLCVDVTHNDSDDGLMAVDLEHLEAAIQYCPMCGRKL